MLDHPQLPIAELKEQQGTLATPITQKKVYPIAMSVEEHTLKSVGLRRKDALIMDRWDILKGNVPSWDNSAVGINTGEA